MKLPFYNGDFYAIDDPGADCRQLINAYPEAMTSGEGKAPVRLVGTPGLQRFTTIGSDGGVRALWMGEGRLFAVMGSHIYEVFADGFCDDYGSVGQDDPATPAQIFVNGNEMLVISAGYAWRVHRNDADTAYVTDHIKLIAAEYTDLAIGVLAFYFDLVIDGTDDTKVSSVLRPFVSGDVGLSLVIKAGNGFTAGTVTVSSVTAGVATLSGSAGVTGSTDGTALLLDGNTDTVNSPTLPFEDSDVGGTLVFPTPNAAGFTPGTYTISSVTDGVATLSSSPGTAGSTGGVATQYPGESAATDANGNLKAQTGAYLDGYGIVAPPIQPNILTNDFYISDNGSFFRWVAIDKGKKEGYADNIMALLADHEELYIFGDLASSEVWQDTGAANFPFERNMGAFMHFGLAAQHSVCQLGLNGIAWLAWSTGRGSPQAIYAAGFQPQVISTPHLERIWSLFPDVRDATAFSYMEDGHHFWVLNFPSADITWVYDLTESQRQGKPIWHARGRWDADLQKWHRARANCHAYGWFANNPAHSGGPWTQRLTHFVGDFEEGTIWIQGLYNFDEDGKSIRRFIQSSHFANENSRTIIDLVQVECMVGDGTNDVAFTFDYSRDRGYTFVNPRDRIATGAGATNQRLRWLRCGESYDWVLRMITDSKAKISITSAWADVAEAD